MKIFSRILSFVFGGVSVADHHRDMSGARTVSEEDKLETLETALRLVVRELKEKEEQVAALEDRETMLEQRITRIADRAEELEKLVLELMATRSQPAQEPEPVAVAEDLPLEAAVAETTQPEPETVPEEPPTPTVEPTVVEEAVTASTEVLEVTAEKPPTVPKTEDVVKQWFTTDKEGVRWHVDQIGRRVRLIPQQDGSCSFPGCPEKKSGAHVDLQDGHGHSPVCGYGHTAAINFKRAHKKTNRPRIQYRANDAELAEWQANLTKQQADEEVRRLAEQLASEERARADAAAATQKQQEEIRHMAALIQGDTFEVKEGDLCAVPNCTASAPIWRLYLGRDDSRLQLLCNAHGVATEELRKEEKRKVRRFRLDFWIFSSKQMEHLFISRQANRRANEEVVRHEREEKRREWDGYRDLAPEAAAEKAVKKQLRDEAHGRQSHTRIKAVPAKEDKKSEPQAAA